MTSNNHQAVTVSAPGKILLAGGYLVLESPNVGVVIGVDKRFYTTAQKLEADAYDKGIHITVRSPQFDSEWKYSWTGKDITADNSNESSNMFVEKTLRVALLYLLRNGSSGESHKLDLTIRGDNDFYSLVPHLEERNMSCTLENALTLPRFLPASKDNQSGKILKTGLGSSACLVTSLVGALCHTYGQYSIEAIFRLSQISHCHAQGKVGSGFDVSAACHGTHIYQRFPKQHIESLLNLLEDHTPSDESVLQLLVEIVDMKWEGKVDPLQLTQLNNGNKLLQVTMADVSGGSESPSMARAVLNWKKQFKEGKIPHWDDLARINQQIVKLLQKATALPPLLNEERVCLVNAGFEEDPGVETENAKMCLSLLVELRRACLDSRRHLKAMGEAAGVPIEPDEQSALADATLDVHGVVAALVPGAGGYDALACVYIDDEVVRKRIGEAWASWTTAQVSPLTVQALNYGDGVRVEPEMIL